MKKLFCLLITLILFAQVVQSESTGIYGTCKGTSTNMCIFVCPGCGELFAPEDCSNPKGGDGKLTRGICPTCRYDFSTKEE